MLGDPPAPVREPLRFGQIAVLVEDLGQGGDLLVEGKVRGAGQCAGDAPPPALFEELVDLGRPRAAQVAEELGREVPVALGVERLGRRRQLVDVARPAPLGPSGMGGLVVVRQQPVLLEPGQLQADGRRGESERPGDGRGIEGPLALHAG